MVSEFHKAAIAAVVLTFLTSSQNVLITWSKRNGSYKYDYVTVTLVSELVKFFISLLLLTFEVRQKKSLGVYTEHDGCPPGVFSISGFAARSGYALPALIYFAKNNLVFVSLSLLDPVTFQVFGNLKIATTAILYRVILKRPFTEARWLSMALLCIGVTVSQISDSGSTFHTSALGFFVVVLIAWLSGLAGPVTEWLMKSSPARQRESLHVQNLWMYFYGALFNLIAILVDDYNVFVEKGFFYGYDWFTVVIILNNALSGIAVSAIMKYSNNIVKLFSYAVSLMLTTVLSMTFFGFEPSLPFYLGAMIVFISIFMYNRPYVIVEPNKQPS